MAQASSYKKLSELTAEQKAKFKETATILAQGKTTADGATTDINIPFSEFGGSSGGSGKYTVVNKTLTNADIYGDHIDLEVQNNTMYFIDISQLTAPSSEGYDLCGIFVKLPAIEANDYYDIVIQTVGEYKLQDSLAIYAEMPDREDLPLFNIKEYIKNYINNFAQLKSNPPSSISTTSIKNLFAFRIFGKQAILIPMDSYYD